MAAWQPVPGRCFRFDGDNLVLARDLSAYRTSSVLIA